ncbi:MAG: carboxypeptidase regulatory-like domain-containing protein, partial [Planctomycetota bacterium]
MQRSTGLLLLLVVGISVALVAFLMSGGALNSSSTYVEREGEEAETPPDMIGPGGVRLASAPGAKKPKTPEKLPAEAAERAKPKFARSEGVFGQVLDGSGNPVAEAVVKLIQGPKPGTRYAWGARDLPTLATATTDEKGKFLVGPAPEGPLRLRAEAGGYAPTVKTLRCRGYRVDLVLDRGGALEVTVKNAKGEPVAAALVMHQAGYVTTEATTNEQGVASFASLPTGTGTLRVTRDGYASLTQAGVAVAPGRTEKVGVVLPSPLVLDGTVTKASGGRPIPGVSVTVRYPSQPWIDPTGPVVSDEAGAFELEAFAGVGQQVQLDAVGPEGEQSSTWLQLQDAGDGRMKVEVKLQPSANALVGQVVDADGNVVAGARVTYPYTRSGSEAPETTTGPDGSFELEPPPWANKPGSWTQVAASAPGQGVGAAQIRLPKEGEILKPVTVRLSGTGTVAGEVQGADGTPVAGALVALVLDWQKMWKRMKQRGNRMDWTAMQAIQNPRLARLDTVTGDDGHFLIEGVPCAVYRISATYGLDTITAEEAVEVTHGATEQRTIELGEGATIEGWTLGDGDQPVPGAYVNARPIQRRGTPGYGGGASVSARSQADGHFVLHGATAEEYRVLASAAGFQSQSESNITPGTNDVRLVLKPLGWIEGVVELDGVPYRGTFTIRAGRTGGNRAPQPISGPGRPYSSNRRTMTFSPDDGTFLLRGIAAGEYSVSVTTTEGLIGPQGVPVRVAH